LREIRSYTPRPTLAEIRADRIEKLKRKIAAKRIAPKPDEPDESGPCP
jgi:hypothetical protein